MLETILADTRVRIVALKTSGRVFTPRVGTRRRSLGEALKGDGLSVIAEVKRRSPSRGHLAEIADPAAQANKYLGAAAISVLTEPVHFSGSEDDLERVAAAVTIPVLRKDFILDPIQVPETAAMGADALLLIVGALTDQELIGLLDATAEFGLEALVEVHDETEAKRALAAGAEVVGVNNRNLSTFEVDLTTAETLAPILADAPVRVAESGINGREEAVRMKAAGYDAILVGEALVRSDDPARFIEELKGGGA